MTSPFSFLSLFPQKGKEISILFLLYSLYWLAPGREQQDKRERLILPLSRTSLSSWAAGFVSMEHAEIPEALKPRDDLHQPIDLPVHSSTDSPQQKYGDRHNSSDPLRRGRRASGGSDRSVEQSSLHRNQAKGSWERKGASEGAQGVAPSTPGRFKTRAGGQGDESPDKGPAVPKFGEWDENNPSSADGFTGIFNKVREEKQTESAKVPHITDDSVYLNSYGHGSSNYKSSGCLCFRWRKK